MRLPPALNVALLTTLSLLAGCLEPVEEGGDPDLDAAAQEAALAFEELTDESGHIAGTVVGDDGLALAGARVELDGQDAVDTDEQGRFAFVDVAPGEHLLAVHKDGYHAAAGIGVPVAAQSIARPSVVLAKVVPPAYHETTSFAFYQQAGVWGTGLRCSCVGEAVLAEGATEALLEVVTESSLVFLTDYEFATESYASDGNGTFPVGAAYGWLADGQPAVIPGDALAGAEALALRVFPSQLAAATFFTVHLTVFYNGPAPEGFTAVA